MAEVFKHVGVEVARMCGNDPIMDEVAHRILAAAIRRATAHRLTGEYLSKLSVKNVPGKKGVRDRIVVANDPAAYSIEWGHTVTRKDGSSYWLEGQHILGGAANDVAGGA